MPIYLTTLERDLDSLVVKSLANGNMLVEINYKDAPGVMVRLTIANEIENLIYEHIGKIRKKRVARKDSKKARCV